MVAPYSNEKVDLLHIVDTLYSRELDQNELIARFLKKFLTFELMPLKEEEIEQQVAHYEPFRAETENNKIHLREFIKQLI